MQSFTVVVVRYSAAFQAEKYHQYEKAWRHKENLWKLWILNRGDLNFCIHSALQQGMQGLGYVLIRHRLETDPKHFPMWKSSELKQQLCCMQ